MTITEFIRETAARFETAELFYGHGTDNADDEAVYLIYGSLGLDYAAGQETINRELTNRELALLEERVERRIEERIPVAYLVNEAWFCGLPFFSDPRALIPRSPIAELIANGFQPLLEQAPDSILDMCTGSGCIGIACAVAFPNAQVDLVDISEDCLALARENIGRHGASERVSAVQSDLFENLQRKYDLIVANPPYVSGEEIAELPAEYLHEPRLGLESAEQGLQIPLRILQQAADYLDDDGLLIMEVGYSWEQLQSRLADVPLLWLEFESGGDGVMAITASELVKFREMLI